MITVVCSSQYPLDDFKNHVIKTSGIHNKIEFLGYENKGEFSLTEIYNRGLKEAKYNHVVFIHHDITIETKQWGTKLLKQFSRNPTYGIIGVAGSKHLPKSGKWWEDSRKMYGKVAHTHEGKTWLSTYSDDLGHNLEQVVVVDGVFFAVDRSKIKRTFDENVKGFHFYDVNFCYENYLFGVKIGVSTMVRINHKSIGMTNDAWEQNRANFAEKFKDNLPSEIKQSFINTKMKVLMSERCFDNFPLREINNPQLDISVILENPNNTKYKKLGFKTLNLKEPFGYKLGDGKWMLNISNEEIVSKENMLYKISNFTFDLIHLNDFPNQYTDYLIKIYPESKIYKENETHINLLEDYKNIINPTLKDDVKFKSGITFVIPTVNRPTLNSTIDSLINQNNDNWKCKVIFDGVEPIYFNDDRIESIKIEKAGLMGPANGQAGLVRNYGIENADTEWIGFVDDDDTLSPDYVDSLLTNYNEKDFVIFKMRYDNGLVIPKNKEIIFGDVGISFAYKNKLDVRFAENRDGEDYDFLLNLKNKTNNYVISDEIMYNVRY